MIEHIRSSIDAASILQSTVAEVRQFLKTDGVLIYRCQDWASQLDGEEQKGAIVAGDGLSLGYIENQNISADGGGVMLCFGRISVGTSNSRCQRFRLGWQLQRIAGRL